MLCLISYDLRTPNGDYESLFKAISALGPSLKCLESLWLIQTNTTVAAVQSELLKHMQSSDSLFVVDITGKPYNGWLRKDYWTWVAAHNF